MLDKVGAKRISIVTGARADYGLLCGLMRKIQADPAFQFQLIVCGMHLSHEFGLGYQQIENEGFLIDEKIEMLLSSDTAVGITKSIGLGVIGFAEAYARLKPNIVILLGDRFETFAAAQAAFIAKIPIAHIHGGELTQGAYDDGMRHSITKMAHLHFVATSIYRERVIQLGEQPDRVFHVGAMVLDSLNGPFLDRSSLEVSLDLKFRKRNFMVTYHPETLAGRTSQEDFSELLEALNAYPDKEETTFIFTKGNADTEGRIINEMIDTFCERNENAKAFMLLGHVRYLSLLKCVDIVVGNSSSGIIEAPYFRIPTVNIGDRQKGRVRAPSVLDCSPQKEAILAAIDKGLSIDKASLLSMTLPYGEGNVADKIIDIIKRTDLFIKKDFYNKG